jgi:predicted ester cyclase
VARRGIDEVWNGGRMEVIDEVVGAGYVRHDPALPQPINGARELEQAVRLYRNAFPDLNIEIEEMHSAGDVVMARFRASGTQRGDLMGIAPTGKSASVTGLALQRFSGGKVTDEFVEWDQLGMLRALGVLPQRDSVQRRRCGRLERADEGHRGHQALTRAHRERPPGLRYDLEASGRDSHAAAQKRRTAPIEPCAPRSSW